MHRDIIHREFPSFQSLPVVIVGAETFIPLREKPLVPTSDDLQRYYELLQPQIAGLRKDAWKHLVWGNPLELEGVAGDNLNEAEILDGCKLVYSTLSDWDGTGCPILTEEEDKFAGEGDTPYRIAKRADPLWKAKEDRRVAFVLLQFAKDLRAEGIARKLPIPPPDSERLIWANINTLLPRIKSLGEKNWKIKWVSDDDFREYQALDIDFQKLRADYIATTGHKTTLDLPTHIEGTQTEIKGVAEGLKTVAKVAGLGIVAFVGISLFKR